MNGCRIMQELGHMLHQYALGGAQCVMQSLLYRIAHKAREQYEWLPLAHIGAYSKGFFLFNHIDFHGRS